MPNIMEVSDLTLPALDVFTRLTEAQLRNRLEAEKGVFIAESPKVIARALDAGCEPLSLLMERKHIDGQGRDIIARCEGIPVYTADRDVLADLTGYALTRGVLCAMRRPPQGKYSVENLKQAQALGYQTIFWSLAYVDWYVDNQPTAEQAYSKLLPRIHDGAIVLLHSTSRTDAEILDDLLTKWEGMGYTFASLDELPEV